MKMVIAVIQPERLPDVKEELAKKDIRKMTVTNVIGCGQQAGYTETYRGASMEINLLKKIRLEIAVNDEFVEPTIETIIAGARTDSIGDGKIFVMDLPRCIRIRTGEEGETAIG